MRIDKLLRTAIGTALTGNVMYNGKKIPIYHKIPTGAVKPYIEIIGQSSQKQRRNKDAIGYTSTVPIRILTATIGDTGGDEMVDEIEQQVIDLLDEKQLLNGYTIDSDYQSQTYNQEFGQEYQTHKIINFFFTIN